MRTKNRPLCIISAPTSGLRLLASLSALVLILAQAPGLRAQTVVQNDTITDFGQVAIQVGFVAEEMAGAWLTSPCDGEITHARVIWLSFTGGASDTIGEWVRVFEEGTFPIPGAVLADLPGPVLQDGFENQFTLPTPVPVAQGQTFVVGFKFLTTPSGLGPSLVTDVDGCQQGRNALFAIPPGSWFNSCSLGLSGDFGLRAVVSCGVPPLFEDDFETGDTSAWSAVIP